MEDLYQVEGHPILKDWIQIVTTFKIDHDLKKALASTFGVSEVFASKNKATVIKYKLYHQSDIVDNLDLTLESYIFYKKAC